MSTPRSSVTARNLSRGGGRVRVAIGELRDVTMIDGTAEMVDDVQVKDALFAAWTRVHFTNGRRGYLFYKINEDEANHVVERIRTVTGEAGMA